MPPDRARRFEALMAAHGPSLGRLAATYARATGEREDLFQDFAVAIWQALPRFRGECSERTFLFRIAHNRGVAHLARRRLATTEISGEIEPADLRPNPEQALTRERQSKRLLDAVSRLPIGYRQVVTLTLEGLSYAEIADVLGVTESNVGARLSRARQVLRTELQESDG